MMKLNLFCLIALEEIIDLRDFGLVDKTMDIEKLIKVREKNNDK